MPPPVPARVKLGRMIAGRPTKSSASRASCKVLTTRDLGLSSPILSMASRNSRRSSALAITSRLAAIISTPNFSSTPSSASFMAVFSAVWPPMVGSRASGRSFSMILATTSGVIGSI